MTFNHRLVRHKPRGSDPKYETYYAIHEVYYDENGKVDTMGTDPVGLVGEDGTSTMRNWLVCGQAFMKPVIDYVTYKEVERAVAFREENEVVKVEDMIERPKREPRNADPDIAPGKKPKKPNKKPKRTK